MCGYLFLALAADATRNEGGTMPEARERTHSEGLSGSGHACETVRGRA